MVFMFWGFMDTSKYIYKGSSLDTPQSGHSLGASIDNHVNYSNAHLFETHMLKCSKISIISPTLKACQSTVTIIKQNYVILEPGKQKEPQKRTVLDWEWPKTYLFLFATHQFFQAVLTYSKFGILKITA